MFYAHIIFYQALESLVLGQACSSASAVVAFDFLAFAYFHPLHWGVIASAVAVAAVALAHQHLPPLILLHNINIFKIISITF